MRFQLDIELGNERMCTSGHVASALLNVVASLREFPRHRGDSKRIQDVNGNTVGEWKFTDQRRIVIELLDIKENPDMGTLDAEGAKLLLRDALGEFITARIPMDEYVGKRYSAQSLKFKLDKVQEVASEPCGLLSSKPATST